MLDGPCLRARRVPLWCGCRGRGRRRGAGGHVSRERRGVNPNMACVSTSSVRSASIGCRLKVCAREGSAGSVLCRSEYLLDLRMSEGRTMRGKCPGIPLPARR
jgi:hypothetical protein